MHLDNMEQIQKRVLEDMDLSEENDDARLKKKIEDNKCNWVSISGGGDPLWNFENHIDWYKRFFEITEGINIELHTSMPNVDGVPYLFFERVVYHLHDFEQLKTIKRNHSGQIVRVVFVVTERFTKDLIDKIATYCHDSDNIDELSFRQMMDNHYEETDYCREYLKEGHQKRWWYIEQNDYNLYYCENEVYTEYRKIGE